MVIGNFWSFPQSPGSVTEIYQELDLSISTCIINVSSPFKAIVVLRERIFCQAGSCEHAEHYLSITPFTRIDNVAGA